MLHIAAWNKRGENKNGRYENQIINYQLLSGNNNGVKSALQTTPKKINFSLDNFQ